MTLNDLINWHLGRAEKMRNLLEGSGAFPLYMGHLISVITEELLIHSDAANFLSNMPHLPTTAQTKEQQK